MDKVKCKDCGYLAHKSQPDLPFEKQDRDGETGSLECPICFVHAHELEKEFRQNPISGQGITTNLLVVLSTERVCARHVDWFPSLSPKDHHVMFMNQQQRKDDKDAQWWRQLSENIFRAFLVLVAAALAGFFGWLVKQDDKPITIVLPTLNQPSHPDIPSAIPQTPSTAKG